MRIRQEQERLKKHGQKLTPDYLADILADSILALMSNARLREVGRAMKALEEGQEINAHLRERKHGLSVMSQALQRYADQKQRERK